MTLYTLLPDKFTQIDVNRLYTGWIVTEDGYKRVYDARVALDLIARDIMLYQLNVMSTNKLESKNERH
jgi:hypothetical protein